MTDLADIGSLVRVAEQHDRLIFHLVEGDEHSYLVEDAGSVFRYRTKPVPARLPSPQFPLPPEAGEDVEPAEPALVAAGQPTARHRPRRRFSRRRDNEDW